MQTHLEYFTGFTLVDITATGETRGHDQHCRDQQRNWETVLQVIGLRAQPVELIEPESRVIPMEHVEFGEFFSGEHRVWSWLFAIEHATAFAKHNSATALLEECFEQVPVVSGLDETARFMLPIFYPYGGIKNIYFKSGYRNINIY
jgi:hypothetical protein